MSSAWPVSTVGEQFDIQLGKMLDSERNVGSPKSYVGNRAVQWGRIKAEAAGVVPLTPSDIQRYRLRVGDLLVCEGGEVGRSAIWNDEIQDCYFQKALHRLRPRDGYDARLMLAFLFYWSRTGGFANYVTQTSIAHLPREKFIQMPLPVPRRSEQQVIAKALEDVDRLIVSLERLVSKKQSVKQGMMHELFSGRTRLPGFTGEWREVALRELGRFLKGRGIRRDDVRDSGVPCIRYGELYTVHRNYTLAAVSFVEPDVAETALHIRNGDILFAGSGETKAEIGMATAYVGSSDAVAGGDIVVLRGSGFDPIFLGSLLNTPMLTAQKANLGQGDAVVHITATALGALRFELPEFEEQVAISSVLQDADTEIEAIKQRLESARAIKIGMMQELLTGRTRLPVKEDA